MQDLVESKEWETCNNPNIGKLHADISMINTTSVPDIWLISRNEDPWFHYLRLWSEELYKLSIDRAKIEIPDVLNSSYVLLEE